MEEEMAAGIGNGEHVHAVGAQQGIGTRTPAHPDRK